MKFLSKNRLTRKRTGTEKGGEEKRFEKFDVFDDKGQGDEEKDDEFIVKMILKPLNSDDSGPRLTERQSKFNKILKKTRHINKAETVTLTQMVKKTASSTENEMIALDKESSSCESSDDSDSEVRVTSAVSLKNTNLFLSAYGGGPRQKMSLIKLLHDVKPKYVILYDSELWFVRQLETYKSLNFELNMRVYFLMYSNSCEEQRYLTSIRSEKESFEILIKEKAVRLICLFIIC